MKKRGNENPGIEKENETKRGRKEIKGSERIWLNERFAIAALDEFQFYLL